MKIKLVRVGASLPKYMTEQAAGMDLAACLDDGAEVTIEPGRRALIPTGISIELPPHLEAQVRPRSGLALKHGVTVLNAPGTIDADYRGEVMVLLINHGEAPFVVRRGERVAQLVVAPVERVAISAADALAPTARGDGGYGHTG